MPINFYSKKQNTVETSTYSLEFVAARSATEQIMDLRLTLRYYTMAGHGFPGIKKDNRFPCESNHGVGQIF